MIINFKISESDLKKISTYLESQTFNKGDVFIEAGKRNDKIGILIDGILISTYISEKGKEEVSRIYSKENGFTIVSNHESFYHGSESTEKIFAVEKSILMVLTKDHINVILEEYPEYQTYAKEFSEQSYIHAIDRIKQFQSFSAKERIENYYNTNNALFNRISIKHLSSFLGTNRNAFTKFLKDIQRKG